MRFSYEQYRQANIAGYITKLFVFSVDVLASLVSFFFAILLTQNFKLSSADQFFSWATVLLIFLRIGSFALFGTYVMILRYVGEKDYRNAFLAVATSSLAFYLLLRLVPGLWLDDQYLAVLLVDFFTLLFMVGGFRIFLRLLFDELKLLRRSYLNTVIFGAGEMGSLTERILKHNMSHNYRIVAFLDDNQRVHKKFLNGVRIFNPEKSFDEVVRRYDVKVAIIAIRDLPDQRKISFINSCLAHQIKVLKTPMPDSWINGTLNVSQIKNINFEDLLNRDAIRLDEAGVIRSIQGKVVLVTGCAGSIGSEMVRQLLHYRPKLLIGFDQAETPLANLTLELKSFVEKGLLLPIIGDVRDQDKLFRIFQQYQPDYVFHAAAYKHVPIMEDFPEEAVKVNILGTKTVADLASQFEVQKFVMISTDKVINPGNVMGASKRIAEIYVQSLNFFSENRTQFITTRFGNVLGSNGSVIPIFKSQIENNQPVTVTHPDVTRFFMTIPEACQLVLEAGAMGNGGEIFIFDMGQPVRIVELAKKMIQLAGLIPDQDIEIRYTGLRPGEKLTEELLDDQEGIIATHHPKIRKAMVRQYEYLQVKPSIDVLISSALNGSSGEDLVRQMKTLVPEFSSQNSPFAALDTNPDSVTPDKPNR